jgi:Mrp family chromosome partitioning ATPase
MMTKISADLEAPPTAWLASLEHTLDETIEALAGGARTRERRALVVEARRLRGLVAKWRCVPPDPEVRDEVLDRIMELSRSAGTKSGGTTLLGTGRAALAHIPLMKVLRPEVGTAEKRVEEVRSAQPTSKPEVAVAEVAVSYAAGSVVAGSDVAVPETPRSATPIPRDEPRTSERRSVRTSIVVQPVELTEPVDASLVVVTDPYSRSADAYRALRRKLTTGGARAVAVTSAKPREGKTTLAYNLALALRETARRPVLLVEADVQAPLCGSMMRFEPPECFLAQLTRNADSERPSWVVAEPFPKLHVLAIDPGTPRAPLLDPIAFGLGMEAIREGGYEHIILDAPPVLGSADSTVISDAVDAVILSTVPLRSKRRLLREAIDHLRPAPILGVVVLEA